MKACVPPDEADLEITPEMISAGARAFSTFDCRFEGAEEIVARIYRAMKMLEGGLCGARISPEPKPSEVVSHL